MATSDQDNLPIKGRIYKLTVGDVNTGEGFEVDGLNMSFDVSRSADNKRGGNSAAIEVWNLSAEHRNRLNGSFLTVKLEVGYETTGLKVLVQGEVTESGTRDQGPDKVTQLVLGEGYVAVNHGRIKATTVGPGRTVADAFSEILKQMPGIARGPWIGTNLNNPLVRGHTLRPGPVRDQLNALAQTYGIEYSIANNVLTLTDRGKATNSQAEAPLLTPDTGLVGSPFRVALDSSKSTKDKTRKFGIQARILCDASIYPGQLVKLESEQFNGFFRVYTARYFGEMDSNNWYCDLLLRDPLSVDNITPNKKTGS
ncbi:hypothetical protein [Pseudomonas sp. Snoq117.2]|uniref:hypothetical protein n=1 Tax=Pseudomonas sp. Snoq117.2 TaxID=1500302 RepID=UPI0008BBCBE7|nr:hypothetical protein [Pseudomonas sp. Snoq117.2]SEP41564.1 hypothetical protein SAMN02787149_1115 [Pseudomonas sp. Snoq117.2]